MPTFLDSPDPYPGALLRSNARNIAFVEVVALAASDLRCGGRRGRRLDLRGGIGGRRLDLRGWCCGGVVEEVGWERGEARPARMYCGGVVEVWCQEVWRGGEEGGRVEKRGLRTKPPVSHLCHHHRHTEADHSPHPKVHSWHKRACHADISALSRPTSRIFSWCIAPVEPPEYRIR